MVDSVSSSGIDKIPQEIRDLKQWTYSHSRDEIKRPRHSHYTAEGCMTCDQSFETAMAQGLSFGMYVTKDDPYVVGDIDHIEDVSDPWKELPLSMVDLLRSHPTYSEVSPSGQGIRFFFKLANADLKKDLDGMKYFQRDTMEGDREAQINIGPPWMRMTGWPTIFSATEVSTITLDDLDIPFKLRYKRDRIEVGEGTQVPTDTALDSVASIKRALDSLPMDKNPRLKRAFLRTFGEEYSHYDYWLKVIMAVHDYAKKSGDFVKCLEHVIQWSAKDKESYKGPEDVHTKWMSLSREESVIGYKTLFRLSYETQLRWPMPMPYKEADRAAGRRKKPQKGEYSNFKALMDHYNIELYRDVNNDTVFYMTGDKDELEKYFDVLKTKWHYGKYLGPFTEKRLIPLFTKMCQVYDFNGMTFRQTKEDTEILMSETKLELDLFKFYFDTPFDRLPKDYQENKSTYERSNVDYIFSCLTIEYLTDDHVTELAYYRMLYHKWLLGLARYLWYHDSMYPNNSVLLLTGKEQIRKTSHFMFLLPKFLREDYVTETSHGFDNEGSMRDLAKLSTTSRVVYWDEIERFLNAQTESNFKKVIDNSPIKFIDKYRTDPTRAVPISIYGATSNLSQFKLGDHGSRRIFHIPVKWVDTDKLMRVNWHNLMNILRMEIEESDRTKPVWLLTDEELEYQRGLHAKITSKTNLDIILSEVWDFDHEFKFSNVGGIDGVSSLQNDTTGRILTTKQVADRLVSLDYGHVKRTTLVNTLSRMCKTYTRTGGGPKACTNPKCDIIKGQAIQMRKKFWLMPPPISQNPFAKK